MAKKKLEPRPFRMVDKDGNLRVVGAITAAHAYRHVSLKQWPQCDVLGAFEAAKLIASGVPFEVAGEESETEPLIDPVQAQSILASMHAMEDRPMPGDTAAAA